MTSEESVNAQSPFFDSSEKKSKFKLPDFNFPKLKHFYIFATLLLLIGLGISVSGLQQQQNDQSKAAEPNIHAINPFVDDPQRGLTWAGIRSGKGDSLCQKLYEVVDKAGTVTGCTHGPDPAPAGIDATQSVEPLSAGEESGPITTAAFTCDGDGTSGYRVQAIYAHASDKADRYGTFATSFLQYAQVVDTIFSQSAAQTGGNRHVRFVTDAGCNLVISRATISPTGDDSFGNLTTELKNQGFNRADRKYMVWLDATPFCGIGTIFLDDGPTQSNWNNTGPLFGATGSGCWGGNAEAHELMHNLGGVQLSAPHTSGGMHCTDAYDRMCYDDDGTGPVTMTIACASTEGNRFDCNKDDYFNTNPPAGSYLATHWNTANNRFLIGAVTPTLTPTMTPTLAPSVTAAPTRTPTPTPALDVSLPVVTISSPMNESIIGNQVRITANATDNVGVVKMEVYIDGGLRTTSSNRSISTNWNSRKASKGTHTILVKAFDAKGNVGSAMSVVYK